MWALAYQQFRTADNMTDSMAALGMLANLDCPERQPALDAFYERWRDDRWWSTSGWRCRPLRACRGRW